MFFYKVLLNNAPDPGKVKGSMTGIAIMFVLYAAFFYFVIMLPQKKRRQKKAQMINEIKKGDSVIFCGGIQGEILGEIKDCFEIKVDKGTKLTVKKSAVVSLYEEK